MLSKITVFTAPPIGKTPWYLERPLGIWRDPFLHLIAVKCTKALGRAGNTAILGNFYL
jgi:hypothetical protein